MVILGTVFVMASLATTPVLSKEIVVTAARDEQPRDQASAALTVFHRDDLQHLPASSLAEVLAAVPGMTIMFESDASGSPMVTSRGFFGGGEVEYVKLLVDGVPVGDAESGNADWQRFRVADIDHVEILRGPGSALYGDTALGGVVQVFTSGERTDSHGEVSMSVGTFGAHDLAVTFRGELARDFRLDANASDWSTDGFRDNAGAQGRAGHLALAHVSDRTHWRIDGDSERTRRQQPGALTRVESASNRTQSNAVFRFDDQTTTRERAGAAFDSFGPVPMHATLYGIHRHDDNLRTLLLAPGFGASAFRSLATGVGGGTFEAFRESSHGVVRAGADLERATLSGTYSIVDDDGALGDSVATSDGRRDRIGLFATGAWTLAGRYHLTAGLRRDDIRDELTSATTGGVRRNESSSAWSPRAGLNVQLGSGQSPVSFFVQLSHAFKAPTLDQLFDPRPYPDGFGGTFTISNPALLPQRARNIEAGLARTTPGERLVHRCLSNERARRDRLRPADLPLQQHRHEPAPRCRGCARPRKDGARFSQDHLCMDTRRRH
jgi:outer membrane receptor protein involved in Fe transport